VGEGAATLTSLNHIFWDIPQALVLSATKADFADRLSVGH